MNKQEILNAFIQAEKDWSEPIETAWNKTTHWGLCKYFKEELRFREDLVNLYFYPRWKKHATRVIFYEHEQYHFNGFGDGINGRAERLEAIRKVIIDLKNELNENH